MRSRWAFTGDGEASVLGGVRREGVKPLTFFPNDRSGGWRIEMGMNGLLGI